MRKEKKLYHAVLEGEIEKEKLSDDDDQISAYKKKKTRKPVTIIIKLKLDKRNDFIIFSSNKI